ncbi:MAG: sigma-70 family RNA polymerase sigma factor [Desulfobacterales bacterium]
MKNDPTPGLPAAADEDGLLVRRIVAGERELFGVLAERYAPRLYTFGRRMCRNEADAEDLVQETLLNAFRHLPEFRFESRFKNWLFRIAVNVCRKRHRRARHAPEEELPLEDLEGRLQEEAARTAAVPLWARLPLERLLSEELVAQVREAIWSLPEKYRVVLVLRDIEEFSTEETARLLRITPANVKVRLHRARLFLRERLKGYFRHGMQGS